MLVGQVEKNHSAAIPGAGSATSRTWPFFSEAEFCKWLIDNNRLYCYNLRTDVSQFNRDGVHYRHSCCVSSDKNPHATMESNFALRLIGNVWCAVLDDQVIGRFTFEGHLT